MLRLLKITAICLFLVSSWGHGDENIEETPWESANYFNPFFKMKYQSKPIEAEIITENHPVVAQTFIEVPPPLDWEEEPPFEEPQDHYAYRLKIGDRMNMAVYGEPHTRKTVIVDFTGCISYLFINSLPAAGKTIDMLRKEIESELKKYYRNPILIATATELLPDFYTIIGEIRRPGKKRLRGHTTLLSALAEGGGFNTRIFRNQTIDTVDLDHSFLARRGEIVPIDFEKLISSGDPRLDIPLEEGDYIYLATSSLEKVYVLGEVRSATSVELVDTMSLAEVIAEAGGLTLRASSRVAVIRGSLGCPEYFLVDINRILKGKACDFPLCPNDIVFVPPRHFQTLKEIIQAGVAIFVSTLASTAGTTAFISVTPSATNVITPIPILNTGGVTTIIGPTGGVSAGVVVP